MDRVIRDEVTDLNPRFDMSVASVINAVLAAEGLPHRITRYRLPWGMKPDFVACIPDDHHPSMLGYSQAFICGVSKVMNGGARCVATSSQIWPLI